MKPCPAESVVEKDWSKMCLGSFGFNVSIICTFCWMDIIWSCFVFFYIQDFKKHDCKHLRLTQLELGLAISIIMKEEMLF